MARRIVPFLVATAICAGAAAATDAGVGVDAGVGDVADAAVGETAADASDSAVDVDVIVARAAPTVLLRIRVLQKGTRQPLAGVVIAIDGVPAGETGADGTFSVDVAPGPHHVQAQTSGHETIDRRIDVRPDGPEELYRLPLRLTGERYQTTIRTGRPELPQVAVSADEARNVAGTSGDPLRVLGSLPGVSQVVWPAAIYVVRVPALFHLALGPSIIHPYLIGGVDFYPGGYPASFGGYASGIMAARTVPPPTDRIHASADVTIYDAGGIMTAPLPGGRGSVAVAARYSYTGALFSLLAADSVLRYGDYQLRADHPLLGGLATVFAFGSLDELGWLDQTAQREYAALQFHRLDARWRRALAGGRLLAGLTLGVDWSRSTLFDRPIRMRALSAAPRLVYARDFGALDLEIGADANAQDFAAQVPDFQRRSSDLGRSRGAYSQGLFATVAIRAGRRLTVAPGIRGDFFAEQGARRFIAQPRLSILYQATPAIAVKANGGRFAQMPSLPVSVAGFEAFGLADLGVQTSLGGSLGVEAQLPRHFTLGLTGYYQRVRLTDIRDLDLTLVDPAAPDFLVLRRGHAYGVELLLRRADQGRVFGWLAYTLSWATREDDGGVLGRSDWDQRHILNLVAGWRLGGGYTLGARFHYNTGRYAPIINGLGAHRQLPAFHDLDLRAARRFVFDRFLMDVYLDFGNATLTRQIVQLTSVRDPLTAESRVEEQGFRIILPTIGVHAEF